MDISPRKLDDEGNPGGIVYQVDEEDKENTPPGTGHTDLAGEREWALQHSPFKFFRHHDATIDELSVLSSDGLTTVC